MSGSMYSDVCAFTLRHALGIRLLSPYKDSNLWIFGPLTRTCTPVKQEYSSCLNWSFPSICFKCRKITAIDFSVISENSGKRSESSELRFKFIGNFAFTKVKFSSVSANYLQHYIISIKKEYIFIIYYHRQIIANQFDVRNYN